MSNDGLFPRLFKAGVAASLLGCGGVSWSCEGSPVECPFTGGKFAPFEVDFTSETSAGGIDVSVGVKQELKKAAFDDDTWQFRTIIKGFVFGLYGSIVDESEFSLRPDLSYQTRSFSRKARVYGVFPVQATSFKQNFFWQNAKSGHVKSKYKGDWYAYYIDAGVLDQALLPLQLRKDLMSEGPDLGVRGYKATSKKRIDDDFVVRFIKQVDLQTPLGQVQTVIYELLKGQHKQRMAELDPGHDLPQILALVDQLIALRKMGNSAEREQRTKAVGDQLNALLQVDPVTIVSISEDEAKSASKDTSDRRRGGGSVVDKASEIDESNARVFFWLSKEHAYLPVQMLAVIDSNAWSKVVIESVAIDGHKLARL